MSVGTFMCVQASNHLQSPRGTPSNCLQGKIPEIPVGGNGDRKERGRIGFNMPSAERSLAAQVVVDYGT